MPVKHEDGNIVVTDYSSDTLDELRDEVPGVERFDDQTLRRSLKQLSDYREKQREVLAEIIKNSPDPGVERIDSTTDHSDSDSDSNSDMTHYTDADDELAQTVLDADDIRRKNKHGLSPAEYLKARFDLDMSEYRDEYELREAKYEARGRNITDAQVADATGGTITDAGAGNSDESMTDFADTMRTGAADGDGSQYDKRARDAMVMEDIRKVSETDMGAAEWLERKHDITVTDYSDETELRADLNAARAEDKRNGWR